MKRMFCAVLAITMLFTMTAMAATGVTKINLSDQGTIGGKQLPKGEYKLTWTGDSNNVQVTLTSADKKTVVTAPAKVVQGPKAQANAVVQSTDGSVKEIWLGGKTDTLVF